MIEQAYDLKNIVFSTGGQTVSANGAGETIAVVDAFGDPDITSDLQTFDANFGISNNDASGKFALTVAAPLGPVTTNAGWGLEESLDVEWAHAIAPGADILLVEAPSTSVAALTDAAVWAASQSGVVAVSMSWGDSPEFSGETSLDKNFTTPASHPGVTFVAASGDDAEPNYPSTSPNVLAVGGTTLNVDDSGNWISESPWSESGGGTSPYEGTNKPDVAYDGDPSTGFLVYDSLRDQGQSGWQVIGGTSAGTPQWSAIIALADQGRSLLGAGSLDGVTQTIPDLHNLPSGDFNDVTGGGLTGLGSPVGEKVISALVGGGITSIAGAATQLVFHQQPTNVAVNADITPAITVDVEDANGNIVTSDNSSVTLSLVRGGVLSDPVTVTATKGVATFSDISVNTSGTYTLNATDGSLTPATSGSFTVNPAPTTTTLAASANPITAGQIVALVATVTSSNGSPTGTVTFMDGSTLIGSVAVNSTTHQAVGYTVSLPSGSNDITVTYNGSSNFAASSASLSETVSSPTTTTLFASSNPITAGQIVALVATVTSSSGSPTGTVTFMDGSTLIGVATVNSTTGQAVGYTISLPVGSNEIRAIYNGVSGFSASSASLTETVNATTTTTLVSTTNPIIIGQIVTLIATVTSSSGSPTGTVTFMDGSTLIGTALLDSSTGQAVGYTISLPAGLNDITATYNGASGFAASSASLSETVNDA